MRPGPRTSLGAACAALLAACGGLESSYQGEFDGGHRDAGALDAGRRDASEAPDAVRALDGGACPRGESSCDGTCVPLPSDGENCGGCGVACDGRCVDGRCIVTLASGPCASVLAVDTAHVYWAGGPNCGSVLEVPLAGGAVSTLYAGLGPVEGIALDARHVYWTAHGPTSTAGVVLRASLGGGAVTTLASGYPWGIATSASRVYWGDCDPVLSAPPASILSLPLDSADDAGAPSTLATGPGWLPFSLAVDAENVYWTGYPEYVPVMSAPLAGGEPRTLWAQSGTIGPAQLAALAGNVVWAGRTNLPLDPTLEPGNLMALAPGAEGPVTLTSQPYAWGVAMDGTNVYFVSGFLGPGPRCSGDGTLKRMPTGGGAPVTLASGLCDPAYVAVDATSAYWTDYASGALMKVTPK